MPLYSTGDPPAPSLRGPSYRTLDESGRTVVVSVSDQATQDHDIDTIWIAASQKYDRGELESAGPPPLVRVTTEDCKAVLGA
jgi:hypothetical protein